MRKLSEGIKQAIGWSIQGWDNLYNDHGDKVPALSVDYVTNSVYGEVIDCIEDGSLWWTGVTKADMFSGKENILEHIRKELVEDTEYIKWAENDPDKDFGQILSDYLFSNDNELER